MEKQTILLIILGSILGLILLFVLAFTFFIYRVTFHSPKKWQKNEVRLEHSLDYQGTEEKALKLINDLLSIDTYQDLWMKSRDGLRLHAYFYENTNSNHFVLMFNGYRGTVRRDFSGGAVEFMKMGCNVVLCEQRAHGQSEGHHITFGRKEQYDVVDWINFAKEKWGNSIKITIVGISMGGATVLYASDKIDPEIKVIADCPYSSQKAVIQNTMRKLKYPAKLIWPFAYLCALMFCHVSLKDDAKDNVTRSKNQILIIHGTGDTIVPYKMSERVVKGNEDHVRYELFEGVEHGLSYIKDSERYRAIIKEFLELQ